MNKILNTLQFGLSSLAPKVGKDCPITFGRQSESLQLLEPGKQISNRGTYSKPVSNWDVEDTGDG